MSGLWYTYGCISTIAGIIIGAAGGHKKEWNAERKEIFQKATMYHFMNNVGIIIGSFNNPVSTLSPICFVLGSLLFSGSLFHRSFTDKKDYSGKLPPFGGVLMMIGWGLLAFKR